MLGGRFDRLSDRKSATDVDDSDKKRLVAEPAVAELVKHRSVPALYHCKTNYFLTENAQMMASMKVSPGRSTVVGNSGLFGESGQCWHSMATPS